MVLHDILHEIVSFFDREFMEKTLRPVSKNFNATVTSMSRPHYFVPEITVRKAHDNAPTMLEVRGFRLSVREEFCKIVEEIPRYLRAECVSFSRIHGAAGSDQISQVWRRLQKVWKNSAATRIDLHLLYSLPFVSAKDLASVASIHQLFWTTNESIFRVPAISQCADLSVYATSAAFERLTVAEVVNWLHTKPKCKFYDCEREICIRRKLEITVVDASDARSYVFCETLLRTVEMLFTKDEIEREFELDVMAAKWPCRSADDECREIRNKKTNEILHVTIAARSPQLWMKRHRNTFKKLLNKDHFAR